MQSGPGTWVGNETECSSILRGEFPLVASGKHCGSLACDRTPSPPVSGSWREEADDVGVFHEVEGPVSPGASYETRLWVWGLGCPWYWPRIAPPNLPDIGEVLPGVWSRVDLEPGIPPRRQPRWVEGSGHWSAPRPPRKRQQRPYTPLMISGTPVERVSSFKYLGVNISEDLTWTTHMQTQVKKARQRLYHLR